MDLSRQREYYKRCKPSEVLEPGDPRYVEIDALGDADHRVRGESWVAQLARRVELSAEPVCELLTGLPGSGKSTELRRLAQRLGQPRGANLMAVVIEVRVRRMIECSGGYPRELVRLLQSALSVESLPLSPSTFERLLNEVGDQYRRIMAQALRERIRGEFAPELALLVLGAAGRCLPGKAARASCAGRGIRSAGGP